MNIFSKNNTSKSNENLSNTIIAAGTIITGDMEIKGSIRVDGILKGNINCKGKVVVGNKGKVLGDVESNKAEIFGIIEGQILMHNELTIKSSAQVTGDIKTGLLNVELGAIINGKVGVGNQQQKSLNNKSHKNSNHLIAV